MFRGPPVVADKTTPGGMRLPVEAIRLSMLPMAVLRVNQIYKNR